MIQTVTLNRNQKPTSEQIRQIEEAAKREIVFDEDYFGEKKESIIVGPFAKMYDGMCVWLNR